MQQGTQAYQRGDYSVALSAWKEVLEQLPPTGHGAERAIVLENLAHVVQKVGQIPLAVDYLQEAEQIAAAQGDSAAQARLLISQAQAYSRLGQNRRAASLLCNNAAAEHCGAETALGIARHRGDLAQEVRALAAIAEVQRRLGNYDEALLRLKLGEEQAADLHDSSISLTIATGLGDVYKSLANVNHRRAIAAQASGDEALRGKPEEKAKTYDQQAVQSFQQGLQFAQQHNARPQQLRIQLQLLELYARQQEVQQVNRTRQTATTLLDQLPDSQRKAYAAVALAQSFNLTKNGVSKSPTQCMADSRHLDSKILLEQGREIAQQIGDYRSEAFALGKLGHWFECQQDYRQATQLTQQAHRLAEQDLLGGDSLYLWDWQLARLYQAQGDEQQAAMSYQSAIKTLGDIRSDILTADSELQFDFRDTIEPIYRELAALKLRHVPASQVFRSGMTESQAVNETLRTVDSLKLAELQNYFGNDCVISPTSAVVTEVKGAESQVAVINTIILPDRTAVIASFPDGGMQVEWIELNRDAIKQVVTDFRRGLESFFDDFETQQAEQLYHWLVKPFSAQLQASGVETLVFVNDGIFRSVPMSALHDGDSFLVEQYAIATTPSLELTDPKSLSPEQLKVLVLGVTDSVEVNEKRLSALPHVAREVKSVSEQVGQAEVLLNGEFSRDRLKAELAEKSYPILHIATHGEFGAEPESNFIVTGNGEKITIGELDALIRQVAPTGEPIELLALTACETAVGDERATLGLAGVAIRAGARSAVASLWSINDAAAAALVESFYGVLLEPSMSRAEALQLAQVTQIQKGGRYAHPAYWAPLVLIGNWL